MIDREKVLKGLECCCQMNGNVCRTECPYSDECIENECVGTAHLCANALELLKEKEIGYREKSDALLKMWMDDDITDGEYGKIMNRLNKKTLNKKVKQDGR